jgi:capsular polysaccharide biosynthesis protein/Mrp family chromosome partitioning ATPase
VVVYPHAFIMSVPGSQVARETEPGRTVRAAGDWIGEAAPSQGLRFYLDLLRARLGLIVVIVATTVGAATLLVAQTAKVYEAEADLLVTPIPGDNENLFGLGLVTESGDPTRDSETLAQVITTPAVAKRVRTRLRLSQSERSLLKNVSAEPVAQSSIVTITAKANDPTSAARLANSFAEAAIAVRTQRMHALLDSVIPQLRNQLQALPADELRARESLSGKLRDLESLRLLPDPTLHFETRAAAPGSPVAPRPLLTIAGALIAALVLGFGAVLAAHMLDTRIEREEDLRLYRIPVVGRIPRDRRALHHRGPMRPDELSPGTRDAFHRLASSLAARTPPGSRTIFLTGAGPTVGNTTTSINLAAALAALKEHVVLVEGDARRPSLAGVLGLNPGHGLTEVVTGHVALDQALVDADRLPGVRVLAQEPGGESAPTPIAGDHADRLIRGVKQQANWLIFDGPPLNYAPDSLALAKRAASILLVVRLGRTRARDLADLAELLTQQGITPDGFIIISVRPRSIYY